MTSDNDNQIISFTPVTAESVTPFPSIENRVPSTSFVDAVSNLGNIYFRTFKIQTLKDRYAGPIGFLNYLEQHPENVLGYSRNHTDPNKFFEIHKNMMEIFRRENRLAWELFPRIHSLPEFVTEYHDLLTQADERFERPFYALVIELEGITDLIGQAHDWKSRPLQRRLKWAEREGHETLGNLQKISEFRNQAGFNAYGVINPPERLIDLGIELFMEDLPNHLKLYDSSGREMDLTVI